VRILGASFGAAVPLASAVILYWLGNPPTGFLGLVFTISALGVVLGPVIGAVLAPRALETSRPILVAVASAHAAAIFGLLCYGLILAVFAVQDVGAGRLDQASQAALGYVVLFVPVLLVTTAFSAPFAIAAVFLLRRLADTRLARPWIAIAVLGLVAAGIVTASRVVRTLL